MEAEIASLEEKLMAAITQKEEVFVKNGFLEEELEALSNKLNTANSELNLMREEIGSMVPAISWFTFDCRYRYLNSLFFQIAFLFLALI